MRENLLVLPVLLSRLKTLLDRYCFKQNWAYSVNNTEMHNKPMFGTCRVMYELEFLAAAKVYIVVTSYSLVCYGGCIVLL